MGRRARTVSAEELVHYREHFLEAIREDGVVCLECGTLHGALGPHLRLTHGLAIEEYRAQWGYNRKTTLMSLPVREKKRQDALARNFGALSPPGSWRKALQASQASTHRGDRREAALNRTASMLARAAAGRLPRRPREVADDTFQALVAEGLTLKEIAGRTGQTIVHTRNRLKVLGLVPAGYKPQPPRISDDELLALRHEGLWASQIAARVGLDASTVSARLGKLQRRGVAVGPATLPYPIPWRRVTDEQLLPLAHAGLSPLEIAERLGISTVRVEERLDTLRQRGLLPGRAQGPECPAASEVAPNDA